MVKRLLVAALWVAHSETGQSSARRMLWRAVGVLMMGVVLMAGEALLMFAAGVHAQLGSVYRNELPATVLCLVGGVPVALLMAALSLDLLLRRHQRSQRNMKDFSPHKRRKRRHRVRQL